MNNQIDLNAIKANLPNREAYIFDLLLELAVARNENSRLQQHLVALQTQGITKQDGIEGAV